MEPVALHRGDPCSNCERGMEDENYHGESSQSQNMQNNLHFSDEEYSISAEESLVSSLSANTAPLKTFTSVAIQMSTLQASFAEKNAEEMKQIVDWYASNNKEDLFTKVTQSQSFPDNPLACADDDDHGATTSKQCNLDPKQLQCKNSGCSTPKSNDSISSGDDQSTDYLPDLAISPSSIESPDGKVYTSSWEAQKQHEQVQDLVEATKYMAHVIAEYDHRRSASDNFTTRHETGIRRRRPRNLTVESPQKVGVRQYKTFLDRQKRAHQNGVVIVLLAILLGSLALYCGVKNR